MVMAVIPIEAWREQHSPTVITSTISTFYNFQLGIQPRKLIKAYSLQRRHEFDTQINVKLQHTRYLKP